MRVNVYGSELSAAVAAAALSSVGHQVVWCPHPDFPWHSLESAEWLIREPGLKEQIDTGCRSGLLTIAETPAHGEVDIHWLALAPDQRDAAEAYVADVPATQSTPLVVINNSTFPVGHTERFETDGPVRERCFAHMLSPNCFCSKFHGRAQLSDPNFRVHDKH